MTAGVHSVWPASGTLVVGVATLVVGLLLGAAVVAAHPRQPRLIRGPEGPPGKNGVAGVNGVGTAGVDGSPGQTGERGPQGPAGVSGAGPTVTYQPGGSTVTGVTYTDFGNLCEYIAGVPETSTDLWTIQIDGSFTAGSPTIPSGVYALPMSVAFVGLPNASYAFPTIYPTLSGESDVVFSPAPLQMTFQDLPFIEFPNLAAPVVNVTTALYVYLSRNCVIFGSGTPGFFAAIDGAFVSIKQYTFTEISAGTVVIDATSSAEIALFDGAFLDAGAVTIASGGALNVYLVDSAVLDSSYYTLPGSSVGLRSVASQISGIQSGQATLASGQATVSTTITATSRITATHAALGSSTTIGTLAITTRSVGSPGSFSIHSLTAGAAIAMGDNSTVEWHVIDTGV
jgi:hypothetical protein